MQIFQGIILKDNEHIAKASFLRSFSLWILSKNLIFRTIISDFLVSTWILNKNL